MYTSISDIFDTIQEKYAGVTQLSRDEDDERSTCHYSHSINGVGCAVGCLLSADDVSTLKEGQSATANLPELLPYFDLTGDLQGEQHLGKLLDDIQTVHDRARDVPEFLARLSDLRSFIESGGAPHKWQTDTQQEF